MPILASSAYVNSYGKTNVVTVEVPAASLESFVQTAFIVKYSTLGKALWTAKVSSGGGSIGYSIKTDSNGNVYVTGQSGSGVAVSAYNSTGSALGSVIKQTLTAENETFLVKYNTDGIVQWISALGGNGTDLGRGISVDSSQNIYLTGQFTTSALVPYSVA